MSADAPGPLRLLFHRVARRPFAWLGLLLVAAAVIAALAAPWLAPYPPNEINLAAQLQPPSAAHLLGADFYGRDVLSRLLYGASATLVVAGVAVALGAVVGTLIGLLAGFSQGWLGQMWVGLIDLLLAFPALLLALLVVSLTGPSLTGLALAVGIAGIPGYARLIRGVTRSLRAAPFIDAARVLGAGNIRILRHHLLPGVLSPLLAYATTDLGRALLSVAALGFLGLGAPPPQAEWGQMLFEGRGYLATAPWTSLVPGLAIALTVLGVTLLGDSLSTER